MLRFVALGMQTGVVLFGFFLIPGCFLSNQHLFRLKLILVEEK